MPAARAEVFVANESSSAQRPSPSSCPGPGRGLEALAAEARTAAAPTGTNLAARRSAAGVAYVLASALCFGSMAVFARVAYASGVDTQTLLLLRFSIAAALMWLVFAARRARLPRGRGLAMLVAMGGLGYAGQAFCFFTALTLASAGLVALLLYLYPALVALLARVALGHRLSRLQIVAVATALAGSVLTIGRAGDGSALGVLFGLLAAFIYACYILTGSRLPPGVTPTASSTVVITSAAVVYAAAAALRGLRLPATPAGWGAVVAIGVICTVMAIAFFLVGLERLGPVRASIYSTLEPAFTLVLAGIVLGERVTALRVAGGVLILGAVILLARADLARAPPRLIPPDAS
jgi:drug/metabolite transporter (DMT)-like permease